MENQEEENRKNPESKEVIVAYKNRSKKLKKIDNESSVEECVKTKTPKMDHSSDNGDGNPHKGKYKPYKELSGEFKKLKHLPSMLGWKKENKLRLGYQE